MKCQATEDIPILEIGKTWQKRHSYLTLTHLKQRSKTKNQTYIFIVEKIQKFWNLVSLSVQKIAVLSFFSLIGGSHSPKLLLYNMCIFEQLTVPRLRFSSSP